jgi:hypothetical protein
MRVVFAVLALLGGCNRVFGLEETQLGDGGESGIDAVPAGCRFIADIAADTAGYIVDETPVGKNIELLASPVHHTILSFAMDGVVMQGEHIGGAVLKLAPTTVCDPNCTPCGTSTATRYQIYWNWDAWKESNVTQLYRDSDTLDAWNMPGADKQGAAPQIADRSQLIVEAPLPAPNGQVLELHVPRASIEVPGSAAEPWIEPYASPPPAMRLSLQLRTDALTAFASDDFDNNTCNMTLPLPTLTVTVCH